MSAQTGAPEPLRRWPGASFACPCHRIVAQRWRNSPEAVQVRCDRSARSVSWVPITCSSKSTFTRMWRMSGGPMLFTFTCWTRCRCLVNSDPTPWCQLISDPLGTVRE